MFNMIVSSSQLYKKQRDNSFSRKKTRPIGIEPSRHRDATKGPASANSKIIGKFVRKRYNHYAIGTSSGGEAVALGCQILHDVEPNTITTYTDGTNAFRLLLLSEAVWALCRWIVVSGLPKPVPSPMGGRSLWKRTRKGSP